MIQGNHLRWGLSTQRVRRISREGEPDLPPKLALPAEFMPFDDGSVRRWTLIIDTRDGLGALTVSRFLELVPIEQVNLQPLPAPCRATGDGLALAPVRITHVALAETSDDLLFLLLDPMA